VKHSIGVQDRNPKLHIDVEADFNAWHDGRFNSFFNQLNRMKPFGPKNREPVFATRLCKAKHVRTVGEEHLKFKVYQEGENGTSAQFDVIAFGFGHLYTDLQAGAGFDLAYTMGINHWNGSVSFQLEAKDLRVSAET
jgi:single-stranded-DNA-specific exonuclease